jgi:hypothetical protein
VQLNSLALPPPYASVSPPQPSVKPTTAVESSFHAVRGRWRATVKWRWRGQRISERCAPCLASLELSHRPPAEEGERPRRRRATADPASALLPPSQTPPPPCSRRHRERSHGEGARVSSTPCFSSVAPPPSPPLHTGQHRLSLDPVAVELHGAR